MLLWLTSNELIDLLADSEDLNDVNQLKQIQEKETLYMGEISNPTGKKSSFYSAIDWSFL